MTTLLLSTALALTPREPIPPMPMAPAVSALNVKGSPSVLVKLRDGKKASAVDGDLQPLIHHDVSKLVARAEKRSGRAQPDYGTLFRVKSNGTSMQSMASALRSDDDVEVVWSSPGLVEPPKKPKQPADPAESYLKFQQYHLAEHGVASKDAWKMGYNGKGVRIADLEFGMNLKHEDIDRRRVDREKGIKPINPFSEHHDHGTAVMGIAIAQPDKAGIRGIAHGATGGFYPVYTEQHGHRTADALLKACGDSKVGDIVMIELQTIAVDNHAPMETDPDVWMATRTCTDAGVIVVAAAGNGSQDLDRKEFDFWKDRGDSGAILVGAGKGSSGSREAEDFSNYGKRVDLQGWGSGVFTLGYGDHSMDDGDPNQAYTAQFGGTSSATPIVAGSVALVQQAAVEKTGEPLGPEEMRSLLRKTGRKHQGERAIGALPNVPAAIAKLRKGKKPKKEKGPSKVAAAPEPTSTGWAMPAVCSTAPASGGWLAGMASLLCIRRRVAGGSP